MKFIVAVLCFMFISMPAFAETSIAIKEGYTFYKENKKSEYEGNNIMDNGLVNGYYFRIVKDKIIYRLDIDNLKTGNTFSQGIGIAYEKVDFKSMPIILSAGKYLYKGLYAMAGTGISLNKINVEQYAVYPFDYSIKNSLVLSMSLGYEYAFNKHMYIFTEARYMYNKAQVKIQDRKYKEDLSNLGIYGGIGWKF